METWEMNKEFFGGWLGSPLSYTLMPHTLKDDVNTYCAGGEL